MKIQEKNFWGVRGGGGGGGSGWWGGQGGCERRIEVFEKIQKKNWGGGGSGGRGGGSGWWGGVRVDVNEELKFLWKFKMGGGRVRGGGQGGCERRIKVL